MADDEDCRRKHFLVLSTFNEDSSKRASPPSIFQVRYSG
jgi:hypothetical protein